MPPIGYAFAQGQRDSDLAVIEISILYQIQNTMGGVFRFGYLKVPAADFKVITEAMDRDFDRDLQA